MHFHRSLLLLPVFLLFVTCRSSRPVVKEVPQEDKDPRWVLVDSLADQGLYASALEHTNAILADARSTNNWRTEFRAWMVRGRFQGRTGVDQDSILRQVEKRASTSAVPLKQLLHSVLAESWWRRYSNDRWRILERTNMEEAGKDPATWTQADFMRRILSEAAASIASAEALQAIPVADLGDLLQGDPAHHYLRPTLYDVLAHRAIGVFANSETRLAEPAWRFTLDDPRDFDLFEAFIFRQLQHRDSTAWEFQVMRLFQSLEKQHLNADAPDALVDVMLERLRYVHGKSTVPEKDSLFLGALEALEQRLVNDSCQSEVTLAIGQWHADQAAKYDRLRGDAWKEERRTAHQLCAAAIQRFPGSFGARNAAVLQAQLEVPALQVIAEEATAPNKSFTVAVDHTNVGQVWIRIVKESVEPDPDGRHDREEWLLRQKPLKAWSAELPDDGDHNLHRTELTVEGLPVGRYTILLSNTSGFVPRSDALVHTTFWCTDLAMVDRQDSKNVELLVVDRTSGIPKEGVKVTALRRDPDRSGGRRLITRSEHVTDREGKVRTSIQEDRGELLWSLAHGTDRYISGMRWLYDRRDGNVPATRSYLFTDRAIYRPGQEIFFKGIVITGSGKAFVVKAGHTCIVRLFDVNGQQVDTVQVISDAFGSYHGSFRAPQGVLTGGMRISDGTGDRYVQVEEYKRPTFEVIFDPIASAAKLGQEANVTAVAKSYAGVPLDRATVQWTVHRGAHMPWWCGWGWRGLPWGQRTEVANGTALCDADGRFTIAFTALPDRAFPQGSDPTFVYTVEASVTDISGETQVGSTSLNAAYRSIDIALNVADAIDRNRTDSIDVRVKNLNGQDMDLPMSIRIVELALPADAPQRTPLWERPDRSLGQPVPSTHLPEDPMSWPERKEVLALPAHRANGRALPIPGMADITVGLYRIEVAATDGDGVVVKASKLITLFDTDIENTGFANEAFHVEPVKVKAEPGEKAVLLISSALAECHVRMEVERDGRIAADKRLVLQKGQQRVDIPVLEEDRGGFAVHFICVERGRVHSSTQWIEVPWSNKELTVEWMSFRDKILPGANEEWRLRISGPKKEKVAAQVLGVMYDASLDHFVPNTWSMFQWPSNSARHGWGRAEPFGTAHGQNVYRVNEFPRGADRVYPQLDLKDWMELWGYGRRYRYAISGAEMDRGVMRKGEMNMMADAVEDEAFAPAEPEQAAAAPAPSGAQPVRSDFRETAFFLPDLLTDHNGDVVLRFTIPDALTRWNVMGLAHTKNLELAQFARTAVTSKPLMVVPNLPRFLRVGDRILLTAKINALEGSPVMGIARLELFDPRTNAIIDQGPATREFQAGPGASANVGWDLRVGESMEALGVRIIASANGMSDGEEHVLPVLTDRVLVTESLPIAINKAGTHTFTLDKLKNSSSSSLKHLRLQLEFTPNPAWYAVQALPYLMEFPHACAEQVFSRYYANRLAGHIVEQRPAIKEVFEQWSSTATGGGGEGAFRSALEKNPELKGMLLEETPWVMNARDEGERKRRIALFFDLQRMAAEEAGSMRKLQEMQLVNGAWPWWSGMQPSRYITQHIVAGFGHLEALKAADTRPDGPSEQMLRRAVKWLDGEFERSYSELLRRSTKESMARYVPSGTDIHYLYARSFFRRWPIEGATRTALEFHLQRAKATWVQRSLQEQAMLALAFARMDDRGTAKAILRSLSERATRSEELGMYWKDQRGGLEWWNFPTETHALLIEAYHEVAQEKASVDALRQYLLKLKQTTDWKTTKATADACYALLLTGDDWLEPKADPRITVGDVVVKADAQEAGTGYFTEAWNGSEVKPAMGDVKVTTTSDGVQWGALHWQYFEQMDKVTAHDSPFRITKRVMLHARSGAGAKLVALEKARTLVPGDKLTIRIELRTDRYVDFVHLKDLRAAGLEPMTAISGYKWQGGLGYYQSIKDAGMHFFFDRISPGTYVLEYDLRVTHVGDFSNGITTAMCMYAPEFSSHSEGIRVKVGE